MSENEIINLIQNDKSLKADDKLWDNINEKISIQVKTKPKSSSFLLYKYASVFSCCIIIFAVILFVQRNNLFYPKNLDTSSLSGTVTQNKQTPNSRPKPQTPGSTKTDSVTNVKQSANKSYLNEQHGGSINGVCLLEYYRYNGNYYKLGAAAPEIQSNIESCLYDNFYKINRVDPSKMIALFANSYYMQLDYISPDSVSYNEKNYLIDMSSVVTADDIVELLRKSGDFRLYSVKGCDSTKQIAVTKGNFYFMAYQVESYVQLNDIKYQVQTSPFDISRADAKTYLGKAGPYDAYQNGNESVSDKILVKVNDSQMAIAIAIKPAQSGQALPKSIYGSVFEGFRCFNDIQYKGHGVYTSSSGYQTDASQQAYAQQAGKLLDTEVVNGTTFQIYQINDVDPAKTVLVKYDGVFVKYDYIFPDTIVYNGSTYSMDYTKNDYINDIRVIKGSKIGGAGPYEVYSIKQIDPSVAIIAEMFGTNNDMSMNCTCTFYSVNK